MSPISAMLCRKSRDHLVLRNSITPEFIPAAPCSQGQATLQQQNSGEST